MRRILTYGGYFEAFISTLSEAVVKKIDYGLYELRTEWEGNIYRVFFIFDGGNVVVLFNGFQKKTQKTPQSEIDKAKKIKEEYYGTQKRQSDQGL